MHNQYPRISLIVVVRNGVTTIQRCIDSVLIQDYSNKEIIVIDGGSTDGTVEVLERNGHKIDYWRSEPDRGIYHAMNKGVAQATGDWIVFLGADDYLFKPDVLRGFSQRLSSLSAQTRLIYGKVAVVSEAGEVICKWGNSGDQLDGLPHQATFHHKSFFELQGCFDESFEIAGDYEMLLRELKNGKAEYFSDLVVSAFSWGGVSTRLETAPTYWWEYARARRQHGLFPFPLRWCMCFAKAVTLRALGSAFGNGSEIGLDARYCRDRSKSPSGMPL